MIVTELTTKRSAANNFSGYHFAKFNICKCHPAEKERNPLENRDVLYGHKWLKRVTVLYPVQTNLLRIETAGSEV
jgi:hypothetical protein